MRGKRGNINNFKYLGLNFSVENKYITHTQNADRKISKTYEFSLRDHEEGKIESLDRRLYLLDTLVNAGYRVQDI